MIMMDGKLKFRQKITLTCMENLRTNINNRNFTHFSRFYFSETDCTTTYSLRYCNIPVPD
jgi:hypothetical protein